MFFVECVQQNTAINTSTINTLLSNVRTAIAEVGLSPQQVEDVSRIVMSDQISRCFLQLLDRKMVFGHYLVCWQLSTSCTWFAEDPVKKGLLEALLPQSVVPSRVAVSLLMWACSLKSSVKLKVSYAYDCFYITATCCGGVRCKCDVISLLFFRDLCYAGFF